MSAQEVGSDLVSRERPNRLTVLIADDHPLIIAGIRRTLEGMQDVEIVGEARSGPHLMELVERRRPQLVLLDLAMPGMMGMECIMHIGREWPEVKMVVLSACDHRDAIDAALNAGASAYIVKSAKAWEIEAVLRQTATGQVFRAPSRSQSGHSVAEAAPKLPSLTDRERSILAAVAAGLTTAAISRDLWVSEHTIKFHLTNIYRKLGVQNRAAAVRYALEHDMAAANPSAGSAQLIA
jgi:NarL family two-component system response regulator LiaR